MTLSDDVDVEDEDANDERDDDGKKEKSKAYISGICIPGICLHSDNEANAEHAVIFINNRISDTPKARSLINKLYEFMLFLKTFPFKFSAIAENISNAINENYIESVNRLQFQLLITVNNRHIQRIDIRLRYKESTFDSDTKKQHLIHIQRIDIRFRYKESTFDSDTKNRHSIQIQRIDIRFRYKESTFDSDTKNRHSIQIQRIDIRFRYKESTFDSYKKESTFDS
ncbi:hypothetical protein HELRODRAFT_172023 [Helobdella robusta]|uniref:Uncharacterized protein n=1 Tax=Helobdella robusta TaxID=6412 RepID=T1F4Y4_HELRO|nr:hypothetical protein HELRODRAFT_172023 [Helobdella robusta]ESO05010.1 hypothetical protein HELRODRAFT_172023 [Helobdella robusta]